MDPSIGAFVNAGAAGLLAFVLVRVLKRDAEREKLYFDFLTKREEFLGNHLGKITDALNNHARAAAKCPGPRDEEESE